MICGMKSCTWIAVFLPLSAAHLRMDGSNNKAPSNEPSYVPLSKDSVHVCNTNWNKASFDAAAVVSAEKNLEYWLHKLPTRLETFESHRYELYSSGNSQMKRSFVYWKDFWDLLPPPGPKCNNLTHFGSKSDHDQAKIVCGSREISAGIEDGEECWVVSIGSNNQWEFEIQAFDRLPCKIVTFDCTSEDTMPDRIRSRTKFYKICIDQSDGDVRHPTHPKQMRTYMTWKSLLRHAGIRKRPDILKLDVEGYEYYAVPALLGAPESTQPLQILMELHGDDLLKGSQVKTAGEMLEFVRGIYDKGYRFTYIDKETQCKHCKEVVAAKVFC